jgi:LmbE family N-acetylglucosaminyl deacetylase
MGHPSHRRRDRWRVVVLSPHFDDAALSVAGVLGRLPGTKAIVTVHGGAPEAALPLSDWDASCGFISGQEAFETRLAEDARACAVLGVEQIALPYADGPYLGRERLHALDEFLAALDPDTEVFIPLGTNQRDHAAVRDQALLFLAASQRIRPRIYADLPYTAGVSGWGTHAATATLASCPHYGEAYRTVLSRCSLNVVYDIRLTDAEWSRKRTAVLAHASQMGAVAAMPERYACGTPLRYPGPLSHELVWAVTSR